MHTTWVSNKDSKTYVPKRQQVLYWLPPKQLSIKCTILRTEPAYQPSTRSFKHSTTLHSIVTAARARTTAFHSNTHVGKPFRHDVFQNASTPCGSTQICSPPGLDAPYWLGENTAPYNPIGATSYARTYQVEKEARPLARNRLIIRLTCTSTPTSPPRP